MGVRTATAAACPAQNLLSLLLRFFLFFGCCVARMTARDNECFQMCRFEQQYTQSSVHACRSTLDSAVNSGRRQSHFQGDVDIIALLPIHRGTYQLAGTTKCNYFDGIRAIVLHQAVSIAVSLLRNKKQLLGNFTIGAHVIDTCSSAVVTWQHLQHIVNSTPCVESEDETDEYCTKQQTENRSTVPADPSSGSGEADKLALSGSGSTDPSTTPTKFPTDNAEQIHNNAKEHEELFNNHTICEQAPENIEKILKGVRRLVIGPSSSRVAKQITTMLGAYNLMQVSYGADSSELDNRNQYPYFFRTSPAVKYYSQAIAAILRHFQWRHVAVFASDDRHGNDLLEDLLVLLQSKRSSGNGSVCVALSGTFSVKDREAMETLLNNTMTINIKVIVLLASPQHALAFLQKASDLDMHGHTWVGTDKWTTDSSSLSKLQELDIFRSAKVLSISPAPPADSYVWKNWEQIKKQFEKNIEESRPSPRQLSKNPWLKKFWQERFNCTLTRNNSLKLRQADELIPNRDSYACALLHELPNSNTEKECGTTRKVNNDLLLLGEARFIVYTFFKAAEALRHVLHKFCSKNRLLPKNSTVKEKIKSLCEFFKGTANSSMKMKDRQTLHCALKPEKISHSLEHLGITGNDRRQAAFVLTTINYSAENNATFFYHEVAHWSPSGGFLWLQEPPKMSGSLSSKQSCSLSACPTGSERVYSLTVNTRSCCWFCERCKKGHAINDTHCEPCGKGYWPNDNQSQCVKRAVEYYTTWNVSWSVSVSVMAFLTGLLALVCCAVFWVYRHQLTSVEASCVFLIIQAVTCFLQALINLTPSNAVCVTQVLLLWPWPSTLYVNWIFFKINCLRVVSMSTDKPVSNSPTILNKLGKLKSILVLAVSSVTFLVVWSAVSASKKKIVFANDGSPEAKCVVDSGLKITYYVMTLVLFLLSVVMAFQTRHVSRKLDESKYVLVTASITAALWACFLPATYILERVPIHVCMSLFVSFQSMTMDICLFCRPIYFLLFIIEPEAPSTCTTKLEFVQRGESQMIRYQTRTEMTEESLERVDHHNPSKTNYLEDKRTEENSGEGVASLSAGQQNAERRSNAGEELQANSLDADIQLPFEHIAHSMERGMAEETLDFPEQTDSGVMPDDATLLETVFFNEFCVEAVENARTDQKDL